MFRDGYSHRRGPNAKGLLNGPGQNNCFLNSAVQVLWHLDVFRTSFQQSSLSHSCIKESCIFCALKELFIQFQCSQDSALPPDALRHALAKTFSDQRRFQLGFMDDAAECFENILWRIHVHITNKEAEDSLFCEVKQCIPHQKFAMTLVEQPVCCKCNATSEPLSFTQLVHYVTTSALCSKSAELNNFGIDGRDFFGKLLQLAGDVGQVRKCANNGCGSKILHRRTLMNIPEIVSIGLVWDSESPPSDHISSVFRSIGLQLSMKDMFHAIYNFDWTHHHELVGIVTYYGKHYSTFFYHAKLQMWIYFDDAVVREVGPSWEAVVKKCERGRFQPLLLLFAANGVDGGSRSSRLAETENSSTRNLKQSVMQKYLTLQNRVSKETFQEIPEKQRALSASSEVPPSLHARKFRSSLLPLYNNMHAAPRPVPSPKSDAPIYSNLDSMKHLLTASLLSGSNRQSHPAVAVRARNDCPSDSAFTDDTENSDTYISRKAVQNVLNLQRQHAEVGSRNSSSSIDSFDNAKLHLLDPKITKALQRPRNARESRLTSYGARSGHSTNSDHGYDSYSVSSSDSYLSAVGNSPGKTEQRLTQIPEDSWGAQDLDKKLMIVAKDDNGIPDCDKLCAEADLLLAKSHDKEKTGDIVMAALLADSAAARARAAMEAPYNNSHSLVSAKMKHSTCVMRSSCLYRRLKDEPDERKKTKGHHSRQSSRDSTHSRHSQQGSKDGGSKHTDSDTVGNSIEIYGTLPKKSSGKKKESLTSGKNTTKDDQIYRDFLEKQHKNSFNAEVGVKLFGSIKPNPTGEKAQKKSSSPKRNLANGVRQPVEESYLALFPQECTCHEVDKSCKNSAPDKKQHKIKRKLMGSFMKCKNRSLPDLTADEELADDDELFRDEQTPPPPRTTNCARIGRGFYQPHRALVKRDSSQKPHLTKVRPPTVHRISPTDSNDTNNSKPPETLPLKTANTRRNLDFGPDQASKIPFMAALLRSSRLTPVDPPPPVANVPSDKSPKTSSIPILVSQISPPPKSARSMLAEIEAKQKEMRITSKASAEESSESSSSTVPPTEHRKQLQCEARKDSGECGKHSIESTTAEPDQMPDKVPVTSVKNLALKFERIRMPKEASSVKRCSDALPEKTPTERDVLPRPPPEEAPRIREAFATKSSSEDHEDSPKPWRPQRPPDYQTAMQRRLEIMRTNFQQEVPADCDDGRRSSKKTVTFSDEVVLVACAEFDESGFFSNPLLGRVYRQHLEEGGGELPLLGPVVTAATSGYRQPEEEDVVSCNLCQCRAVASSSQYCANCAFYMAQYQNP